MRRFEPAVRPVGRGELDLRVSVDVVGEVLVVADVSAGRLRLGLGRAPLTTQPGRGRVELPTAPAALALEPLAGEVDLTGAAGEATLPLPAVVPLAVDVTRRSAISATVHLVPTLNGSRPRNTAAVGADNGFGLEFELEAVRVTDVTVPGDLQTGFADRLTAGLAELTARLFAGRDAVVQPTRDVATFARAVADAVPAAVEDALHDAFTGLATRTGRLVFPPAGPGASCDIAARPSAAAARLGVATNGSLLLQVAVDRRAVDPRTAFPAFQPTGSADVAVAISNDYLRDLLCCLLHKLPALGLPAEAANVSRVWSTPTESCCEWTDVRVTLGLLSLRGTMVLCIAGAPGMPKSVVLQFKLGQTVHVMPPAVRTATSLLPGFVAHAFGASIGVDINVDFSVPLAFDLTDLAAVTGLRLADRVHVQRFDVSPNGFMVAALVAVVAGSWPVPVLGAGVSGLALLALALLDELAENAMRTVLAGAPGLESPSAAPRALFEAFGSFVPTSLTVDDLDARGVLATPTSAWSVPPIARTHWRPQSIVSTLDPRHLRQIEFSAAGVRPLVLRQLTDDQEGAGSPADTVPSETAPPARSGEVPAGDEPAPRRRRRPS